MKCITRPVPRFPVNNKTNMTAMEQAGHTFAWQHILERIVHEVDEPLVVLGNPTRANIGGLAAHVAEVR